MEVIRYKKIYEHHSWEKDDDGNVDEWAWEYDYHNGVACENCCTSICVSCEDYTECDTECSNTWNECPHCRKHLFDWIDMKYCMYCGGEVEYNRDSLVVLIKE